MTRLLHSCTALTLSLAFTTAAIAQEPLKALGAGEGEVSIVAWAGYIERGETDKNYDWVTEFEKKTSCKVTVKTAATSDEMVALMNEGGFDLVTASGDASLRLVAGKRVQPINTDLIPSWKTIDERLQNAPWHTVNGVHYGTPYLWGPNVLMYNTEAFKGEAPKSWNVVFEEMTLPDGKSNKGRVQAYDGPIHIADAAQYLMKHKPELGIKDPYELNEDQYKAALDLLRVQRTLVGRYWHDAMIQIDDFKNEGVVASGSWPFQVNLMQAEKQPIASTFPEEGVTGWSDTTMLHAESQHPNCAYMWMEHSLSAKVQGDAAAWFGAVPSVPAACKGNALLTDEGCKTNGFENFEKIAFWRTPVTKCESQGECVPYHRWVSDYIGVIGGR
ncbi:MULTISPECIES: ABC transporter substrate-binding protein [unclassified Shinella]|jgi:putative spermidine/putrescine transport system substrate-binding protein|uniref:ABC transporter substrate-binding protein n=1 Tax=unclassified Shinella TaxID=2643062 RepID=UPI0003C56335|nr:MULTISPECIES: ABC transporter substrate-binding protein [unclassified Shinella]EYR82106.1 putative putrescine and agmatine ABC transporter,periplasmic solute-binding component [Shinella sp. DD12]KNY15994.1 spermidine/putrescine ABC transporter substrate-binding protein [Shinella sp. SUS2]KOC73415.1 spermidine/putrescine ABC transporter substrate-binding protein [Shinella sp. GWS1]MCO5149342.1 ABC transporter substrate-binding protein [Shinella sp.]MDC7262753.1 ABC transporter substrate-bind